MNNEIFQNIFDILLPTLPEDWKQMVFFAGYTAGSYTMKFYISDVNGEYTDCFNLKGINKAQLIKLFMNIDKVVSEERKKLDDKNRWTVLTMSVTNDGIMKTEFDYDDISESTILYEKKWKEKYIK